MGRGRRALGLLGALALAQVGIAAGCVDGVTPDCSDAVTPCGPSLAPGDSSADHAETMADVVEDTARPDTFAPDADAALDARDAGDAG